MDGQRQEVIRPCIVLEVVTLEMGMCELVLLMLLMLLMLLVANGRASLDGKNPGSGNNAIP